LYLNVLYLRNSILIQNSDRLTQLQLIFCNHIAYIQPANVVLFGIGKYFELKRRCCGLEERQTNIRRLTHSFRKLDRLTRLPGTRGYEINPGSSATERVRAVRWKSVWILLTRSTCDHGRMVNQFFFFDLRTVVVNIFASSPSSTLEHEQPPLRWGCIYIQLEEASS
jgi:hypothetical protein